MEATARRKFQTVFESEAFKSLSGNDLQKLQSYSKLMKVVAPPQFSKWPKYLFWAWLVLAVVLSSPVVLLALVHNGFLAEVDFLQAAHWEASRIFMENFLEFGGLEGESCILQTVEGVEDMFRPPVDCSICRNVTDVERVSGISTAEFEANFAYSSKPVIVTDAMGDWTAPETFTFEYLKAVYRNASAAALDRASSDCQFFPYTTKFASLREVFAMSPERARLEDGSKPWYIGWSNCDSLVANTLRQHYRRPYFLPSDSESSSTDWIFMGTPGYGAPNHIDNVGLPSWQAQVRGTKKWILEPPPECYIQCHVLETVVHPGEIIVLDTDRWFHKTLIKGDDLSITIGSEYD